MGYLFSVLINAGILKQLIPNYFSLDLTILSLTAILVILTFEMLIKKRKFRNVSNGNLSLVIGAFTIFAVSVLFSSIYTNSPLFWKDKFFRFIILNIPSFIIPVFFFKLQDIKNFIRGSIIIFIIIISYYLYFLFEYGLKVFYITSELELPSYLTWGSVLAFNTLLLIGAFFEKKTKKKKLNDIYVTILAFLCMLMIFISGARGPFIFFVFSFIAMLFIRKKIQLLSVYFIFILLSSIIYLSLGMNFSNEDKKVGRSERILHLSINSTSVQKRFEYFKESWDWIEQKALFGYGIGSFSYVTSSEDTRGYPHNLLIEIWFENGLLAVSLFCMYLSLLIYIGIKNIHKPYVTTFLVINIYFIASLMKSSSLTDARVFFAFAGMLVATSYGSKITNRTLRQR